jgi:5-methylcytosine-specific restriction endonuclease McrA
MKQTALCCGCGCAVPSRGSACRYCLRRARLNRERYAGLREAVLRRDDWQCQGCGAREDLLVHHRRPGKNADKWLLTLCRGCHTQIHRTKRPRAAFAPLLRTLWRETHRRWPEQRLLFDARPAEQCKLFV